jgi:hypothetical protein
LIFHPSIRSGSMIQRFMRTWTFLLLLCFLFCLTGCDYSISQTPHRKVDRWITFDPNDYDIHVEKQPDGAKSYSWNRDLVCEDTVVLPYMKSKSVLGVPVVGGQINGTTYPVIFDTGCSPHIFLSDNHINRHQLPVLFFEPEHKANSPGLAIVEHLNIGGLRFDNYPCGFLSDQTDLRFFGFPSGLPETILFPLDIMLSFRYVEFNQIRKELSISCTHSCPAIQESEWVIFPFEIINSGSRELIVTIPIEGIPARLYLDTGGALHLKLNRDLLEQLFEKRPDLRERRKGKATLILPHHNLQEKSLVIRAKGVRFGDSTLREVSILSPEPSDTSKPHDYQGVIGIDLFKNTILVLDFEHNMLRVKKTKDSLFEKSE